MLLGMKEAEPSSRTVIITSAQAGRLLSNPDKLPLLCPFFAGAYTVKEAAELLGLTLNATYLQVQRFYRAGLLEVAHKRPRAGRAVKVYRVSATAFFVPLALLEGETRETLLGRVTRSWEDKLVRGILKAEVEGDHGCGVRVALGDEGKVTSGFVASPDDRSDRMEEAAPAVIDTWPGLRFTDEVAKALQRDLHELGLKYRKLYDDQGEPYVVRLAMAPQDDVSTF